MIDKTIVPKGYVGKILHVDLSSMDISELSTYDYVPEYIGGKGVGMKIFNDMITEPGMKAFDPENPLIYMTGPGCGTGLPSSGRGTMVSLSPKTYPEMVTWAGLGGFFGPALKCAGYDGLVITGKAPHHAYLVIDDGKVELRDADADGLWGEFVIETQEKIYDIFGNREYHSFVCGPAGETLMRDASVTTSADNAAAKAGFGAVMGSKNLKAVVVHGTGDIPVNMDAIGELYKLRGEVNDHRRLKQNNAIERYDTYSAFHNDPQPVKGGWRRSWLACSPGCTLRCNALTMDRPNPFKEGEIVNESTKCVEIEMVEEENDFPTWMGIWVFTPRNKNSNGMNYLTNLTNDEEDPYWEFLHQPVGRDKLNYWPCDFDRGMRMSYLCNEYGIDKWETTINFQTWLSACKQEGLFEGDPLGFGREVGTDFDFLSYFFRHVVYADTEWGKLFHEGMARAIKKLGKGKWGNTIYHNRWSTATGEQLDIPVSLLMGWGYSTHWLGRGFQGGNESQALMVALETMVNTRDKASNSHQHTPIEDFLVLNEDPYHNPHMAKCAEETDIYSEIKESYLGCEWTHHRPYHENEEHRLFNAATGFNLTREELFQCGQRIHTLVRSMEIRLYDRTRDMEVEEFYPHMSFPNYQGWAPSWDDWNDAVDLYYNQLGWDRATGWPTREKYDSLGLGDVADRMEELGFMPIPGGDPDYVRKESPFTVGGHFKPDDFAGNEELMDAFIGSLRTKPKDKMPEPLNPVDFGVSPERVAEDRARALAGTVGQHSSDGYYLKLAEGSVNANI